MIHKIIFGCLIGVLFFSFSIATADVWEINFKFNIDSRQELETLTRIISIDNVEGNTVYANANAEEWAEFQTLGYAYEILPTPERPRKVGSGDLREWDEYPTYDGYLDMMYQYAEDYPELCVIVNAGQSVEGRDILFAKISDNVNSEEDEPEFMYTSSMHGDETAGYILMLRLIDYLLSNYGEDDRITNLVENVEIWINPLANPDGTYYGGNDSVWGAIRRNVNGVDLNRNFPDPDDGPHPDGHEWQAETLVMMDLAEQHSFAMSANFHGGTEVVNYPWDTYSYPTPDDDWWQQVSHAYADTAQEHSPPGYMDGYNDGITRGYLWYPVSGGRQDYMNYYHGCREVTIELSDVKLLPENQLPAHWEYNYRSFLNYIEECLYGIRGVVTNSEGSPLAATITVLDHDEDGSQVYTDPDAGDYHRMLYEGTYDIQITAEGYLPQTFENITIEDDQTVRVDVTLQEIPVFTISGTIIDIMTGDPIPNTQVELLNSEYSPVMTDENGFYQIENVVMGTYTMRVHAIDYTGLAEEVTVEEGNTIFDYTLYASHTESFETGEFPEGWTFGGNSDWIIDTIAHDGIYSAKSGRLHNYQRSQLFITQDISHDGDLVFYYHVSSQDDDYLEFYVDGNRIERWSGEIDWTEARFPIMAGEHTFKWVYQKSPDGDEGEDCARLDFITFPPMVQGGTPDITIDPVSFDLRLPIGESETNYLTITNSGQDVLSFIIEENEEWLQVTPDSGAVVPGNSTEIEVIMSAIELSEGIYNGELLIFSNDPDESPLTVPIQLDVYNPISVDDDPTIAAPTQTALLGNYPNPFNPQTTIRYTIADAGQVIINIYNIKGELTTFLIDKYQTAGYYEAVWTNQTKSSGIYFYQLELNGIVLDTKQCVLLK